jgi:hypothetical protein
MKTKVSKSKSLNVSQLRSLAGFKSQEELRVSLEEFIKKNKMKAIFNLPKLSGLENNSYIPTENEFFALRDYFAMSVGDLFDIDIIAVRRESDNRLLCSETGEELIKVQGDST